MDAMSIGIPTEPECIATFCSRSDRTLSLDMTTTTTTMAILTATLTASSIAR
jgi:hypothetical protein